MRSLITIVALSLSCGCGACSVAPPSKPPSPSVTTYQLRVREAAFDGQNPGPDSEWYFLATYEVWDDDPKSDREILVDVLTELRLGRLEWFKDTIRVKQGKVDVCGVAVFRAARSENRSGQYTSGIIVTLDELFDLQTRADRIVETANLHKAPITSQSDAMMQEFHSGSFEPASSPAGAKAPE